MTFSKYARFDAELVTVNDGEECHYRFIPYLQLSSIIRNMQDGDDLTVHRVTDAEPGVIYPADTTTRSSDLGDKF